MTTGQAFRMLTTEGHRIPELAPALRYLPLKNQAKVHEKITARTSAAV